MADGKQQVSYWVGSNKQARRRSKNDAYSNESELETSAYGLILSLKYRWLHTEIFTDICMYILDSHTQG